MARKRRPAKASKKAETKSTGSNWPVAYRWAAMGALVHVHRRRQQGCAGGPGLDRRIDQHGQQSAESRPISGRFGEPRLGRDASLFGRPESSRTIGGAWRPLCSSTTSATTLICGASSVTAGPLATHLQHRLDSPVLIPRRLLARCEPAGVAISPFIGDIAGNTQAVYAFDPMKLGRHWEATGGLRWERPVRSPAIWTTYNIRKLTVGGGPRFAGKRYRNNANTRFVGNYWTMDAMVMYPVSSKLDLRLNLYNLNNAYYSGTPHRVRTDLSATLFFSQPDEYEGGELTVEDTYGVHTVKLPAGHMVLYPASSLHHVRPVTRGARTLLFDLDMAIQQMPDHPSAVPLTGVYHNLLRRWADA